MCIQLPHLHIIIGTKLMLKKFPDLARKVDSAEEVAPTSCNKDTGSERRLQKWQWSYINVAATVQVSLTQFQKGSENYCVSYRSEGPAQVFLLALTWLVSAFAKATREERQNVFVAYDDMCHLDGLKVAQEPLPLPGDLQYI